MGALMRRQITGVARTRIAIIAIQIILTKRGTAAQSGSSIATHIRERTSFYGVLASIGHRITGVDGARISVITIHRSPGKAAAAKAGLSPVAFFPVVAIRILDTTRHSNALTRYGITTLAGRT